jgi:hypothetical protein
MKKFFTIFLVLFLTISVNAKNVFVATSGDNSDGSSWAKALTSIPNNSSSAISAGDSVFVKAGTYSFSQTVAASSAFATKANVNYIGGFAGTESNSAQRVKSDLDNNGIVEPWEFSNATVLSISATNNAFGLYITVNTTSQRVFEGFKITGTMDMGQLSGSTGGNNMVRIVGYTVFKNNTLSACTLSAAPNTATSNMGYTKGALIYIGQGSTTTVNNVVDNCLIENNTSTITPTSSHTVDVQQSPFVHIDASNSTGRNVLSNCVFRNNQVTLDYTNFGMGTPSYNNPRGMLISMSIFGSSALIGQYNCIRNLLVHNNSATFIPKGGTGTSSLSNGGLIFTYNTAQATYDSILNCTVANNSMTRIGYAIRGGFSNTTQPYHVIANNVLLENKNNNGTGTISVQNLAINQAPAGAAGTITIANNIGNGGISATANVNNVFGNITDLSAVNDNVKGAYFNSPTSIIGYTTDASVATSNWTIQTSSYLKGKGIVTSNKSDKAGVAFSLTTPAVGAYEYFFNPGTGIVLPGEMSMVSVVDNGIISNVDGQMQIFTFNGQMIASKQIQTGQHLSLRSGVYIIRILTGQGTAVQKIVL